MQRLLTRARGVMRDSLNNECILNNLLFNLVVLEAWPEKVVPSSMYKKMHYFIIKLSVLI